MDEYNLSAFHHLESGIEFMAAPSAADAVAFGHHLFGPDAHAPAVGAAHQMAWLLIQGFVARAAKAIDRLPIEFPLAAGVIRLRQRNVVVPGIFLQRLRCREPMMSQFTALRVVERVASHDDFGGSHRARPGYSC